MDKTFEEKMDSIEANLEKLKNPETTLEEGLKIYEEGYKEIELALKELQSAEIRIKNYPDTLK
jgi:exodeoxyribonuclease VII small subunit